MYVQKEKADLIGRHKIKKIEDRYNHIISNNDTAENCFRALIKSYFDIAEYTGVAIKYYSKTGYSTLADNYGYNDICKFDEYAKKCYEITQGIRDIVDIKFEKIMKVEEVAALISAMDEKAYKNEFGISKDYFVKEYKKNLFLDAITTCVKINIAQEFDPTYKYDEENNYNLLMDMYDAYMKSSSEYLFRDGVKPQFEEEITNLIELIRKNSKFKGKLLEK